MLLSAARRPALAAALGVALAGAVAEVAPHAARCALLGAVAGAGLALGTPAVSVGCVLVARGAACLAELPLPALERKGDRP